MTKPQLRDFKTPAEFVTACERYMKTLASEDPADKGARADEGDEERTDAAPEMGTDPWAYARACEAHLARRLDGKAHKIPDNGGRSDAAEENATRYSQGRIER